MAYVKLAVLGATGSIGQSALSLAGHFPDRIEIVAMACGCRIDSLAEAMVRFRPKLVSVLGEKQRASLLEKLNCLGYGRPPEILIGIEGLVTLAQDSGAETVLSAIVGAAGLRPTFAAVKKGLKVALANKESLVLGGEIITPLAEDRLVPVDSEHSAIFQALGSHLASENVRRIILTASGGPFRGFKKEELGCIGVQEALRHPRWSMGPKITCDSATLMNKGLEIIEAHHLFQIPYEKIEVLVHPQSVVHSLVEFVDGCQLAQLGPADMRLAIAYALSCPDRWPLLGGGQKALEGLLPLELSEPLVFEPPDRKVFKALDLALEAGRVGGTAPAILNGANEEAVMAFLDNRLGFLEICEVVEECLNNIPSGSLRDIESALEADGQSRALALKIIKAKKLN